MLKAGRLPAKSLFFFLSFFVRILRTCTPTLTSELTVVPVHEMVLAEMISKHIL